MLEPDRDQLEMFCDALMRHASADGYVSVRAFYEDDGGRSFRISPTSLKGGLTFLCDVGWRERRKEPTSPS